MEKVLINLREKSILHHNQVIQIKQYIDKKYALSSSKERATIFANAVHQIVDRSVSKFEEKHRIQIRTEVLKSAIAKELFDINGYDVFEVCALLPIEDKDEKNNFFGKLTEWINDNQEVKLTSKEVQQMAVQVLEEAVNALVVALEETMLVEPELKNYVQSEEDKNSDMPDVRKDLPKDLPPRSRSNLSAKDIERALSEPLDHVEEVHFPNEIINEDDKVHTETTIKETDSDFLKGEDMSVSPNSMLLGESLHDRIKKDFLAQRAEELKGDEPEMGHEYYDSLDIVLEMNRNKEHEAEVVLPKDWEELNVESFIKEQKKEQVSRLGGYDKHNLFDENRKKEITQVKILVIVTASIVSIAMIIFLIIGAIRVSTKNSGLFDQKENREAGQELDPLLSLDTSEDEIPLSGTSNDSINGDNSISVMDLDLTYHDFDRSIIIAYLETKDSMLVEGDYLDQLIEIAKEYDVNPLLLISIIGQEQGFVPRTHKDAAKIINNPFNVYNSWLSYNTDFVSSCSIAAKTINSSSLNRPEDVDPIQWINRIYAEDQNWHQGVSYFFTTLTVLNEDNNE